MWWRLAGGALSLVGVIAAGVAVYLFVQHEEGPNLGAAEPNAWLDLLGRLPFSTEDGEYIYIHVTDYARMRTAHIPQQSSATAMKSFLETRRPGEDKRPRILVNDTFDVSMSAEFLSYDLTVGRGRFPKDAFWTDTQMEQRDSPLPAAAKPLHRLNYNWYSYWRLGRPDGNAASARMQLGDRYVYTSTGRNVSPDGGMMAMLDAVQGRRESMRSSRQLTELIAGTDKLNLYEAFLVTEAFSVTGFEELLRGEYKQAVDVLLSQRLLLDYYSFASGWSTDDKGGYLGLVILNISEASAKGNAVALRERYEQGVSFASRRPWREILPDVEIVTEGRLNLVKYYTDSYLLWRTIVDNLDNLWMTD